MEKTLNKIQKFAKAGSVISKIILWCSIVCGICSILLLIAQLFVGNSRIVADSTIIFEVLKDEEGINLGTIYCGCVVSIILCISEIIVSKKAVDYFNEELKFGSPFNLDLADKLKKLGVLIIVVPLVGTILANVAYAIFAHYFVITTELDISNFLSLGLGVCFIFISLLCRYVVQKENNNG